MFWLSEQTAGQNRWEDKIMKLNKVTKEIRNITVAAIAGVAIFGSVQLAGHTGPAADQNTPYAVVADGDTPVPAPAPVPSPTPVTDNNPWD
jgi:hypothetical protein